MAQIFTDCTLLAPSQTELCTVPAAPTPNQVHSLFLLKPEVGSHYSSTPLPHLQCTYPCNSGGKVRGSVTVRILIYTGVVPFQVLLGFL